MSKGLRQIVSIALPIGLSLIAPGIGTALGSTLGAATLAGIGGAVGGGISGGFINHGGIAGALTGAAMGGVGGYLGGGGGSELLGGTQLGNYLGLTDPAAVTGGLAGTAGAAQTVGQAAAAGVPGQTAAAAAPAGAATGGSIARTLGNNAGLIAAGLSAANAGVTTNSIDAANEAAKIQAASVDKAIAQQAPYNAAGISALNQIQQIQADPTAYVQNNQFYKSLADDAQQRLMANQASKGKVGSGGTADALQSSLLNLGNGLVQQQIGQLQTQVNGGQAAAGGVSNLLTDRGAAEAAGKVGASNALNTGYQNQISTILALQNLSRAPSYQPTAVVRA